MLEILRNDHRYQSIVGGSSHRRYVADVDGDSLAAEQMRRMPVEIEMNLIDKDIGGR